jgi:CHAT domain-containing protein
MNYKTILITLLLWGIIPHYLTLANDNIPLIEPETIIATSQVNSPLQMGKQAFDQGKFRESLEYWQQAQKYYQNNNNPLQEALVSSLISLAYQELGQLSAAENSLNYSLKLIENNPQINYQIQAQILNTKGRWQLLQGKLATQDNWQDTVISALKTWQEAENLYQKAGDYVGVMGSKINQAQALQTLGFYRQANKILTEIKQDLAQQTDDRLKITGLRTLGNLQRQIGQLPESKEILEQAILISSRLNLDGETSLNLLSLANTFRSQKQFDQAIETYQKAANLAISSSSLKTQIQLNQLSLLIENQQWQQANNLWEYIVINLNDLPASRSTVYTKINLGKNLTCLKLQKNTPSCVFNGVVTNQNKSENLDWSTIINLYHQAIEQGENLQDPRLQSYALGNLGQLYEQIGESEKAIIYTQEALKIAQTIQAIDIAYQWQWQLGRLTKNTNPKSAIAAYEQAVKSLGNLRGDLVSLSPDLQFNFREQVEPIYREFVEILLRPENIDQKNLKLARETIEALQLAELNNFFREACLDAKPEQLDAIIDQATTPTAAVYAIVLPNSIEVVIKLPKQTELLHYSTVISQDEVEATIAALRQEILTRETSEQFWQLSGKVYDWLMRQPETDLVKSGVKNLVFVLDFSLQNVPLAVLDDGDQFLVEKYALALSPGLQLLEPESLNLGQLSILAAGISEELAIETYRFDSLKNVPQELSQIQETVTNSKALFNQSFVEDNLRKEIEALPFSVVHIATHGNFSSDPDQTFILLWDALLKAKNFDEVLRIHGSNRGQVIDLLTLSACQTAEGDKRASLGLAGIAVKAGARSTLATLWQVDDASTTELMIYFYQQLRNNPQLSKAEALRLAQLHLLEMGFNAPFYWSPFVLIGNWQ